MDSLLSTFLLFIAAITALLTYMIIPRVPIVTLVSAAAIVLAAGVWWHWTQFSTDYRTSTWQEQLRNYASYVIILVVILLSYGFYVFAWSGSSIQDYAARAGTVVRNAGRKITSQITGSNTNTRAATNSIVGNIVPEEVAAPPPVASNRSKNTNFLT
jgi:hypothetical protein